MIILTSSLLYDFFRSITKKLIIYIFLKGLFWFTFLVNFPFSSLFNARICGQAKAVEYIIDYNEQALRWGGRADELPGIFTVGVAFFLL